MAKRKTRNDGIRTMADLLSRCREDEVTGCMVIQASMRKGTYRVWLPAMEKCVELPAAIAVLAGVPLQPGRRWVPRCGNTGCCNMKHRFIGTRGDLMQIIRPRLDPLHRSRITATQLATERSRYSAELKAEILGSDEPAPVIATRIGIHVSQVYRIRRGEVWRDAAPTASVFSLGASL